MKDTCSICAGSGETLSYTLGTMHVDCPMCGGIGLERVRARIRGDWQKALKAALKAVKAKVRRVR